VWCKAQTPEWKRRIGYNSCKKRRAQMHEVAYVHINLEDIATRDRWTCHLCGKRVTRKTWSLDHLLPISKGGPHLPSNVALAHRSCNSKRHVDKLPAQLRLDLAGD
jgi:5-methylcytosine-specific restriction endonuclease McrA